MTDSLEAVIIAPTATLNDAITKLDAHNKGIVLITDQDRKLIGTVTDGDIRRAILAGEQMDAPVMALPKYKTEVYQTPLTAPESASDDELLALMRTGFVRQIPLVNQANQVVRLVTIEDLTDAETLPVTAVVMAGGIGTRLRPLTEDLPKPLLPIGDRPILEWIIRNIRNAGMTDVILTTYYLKDKIHQHIGDGRKFGVSVSYIDEEKLSGTAGALSYIDRWERDHLVINGDILTQIDFRALFDYHRSNQSDITVGLRDYTLQVPYGVIDMDGIKVSGMTEKPALRFFVNAGIYMLAPSVSQYLNKGEYVEMPDLIQRLIDAGKNVVGFPIREYWLDIGQHAQYEQALRDIVKWEA